MERDKHDAFAARPSGLDHPQTVRINFGNLIERCAVQPARPKQAQEAARKCLKGRAGDPPLFLGGFCRSEGDVQIDQGDAPLARCQVKRDPADAVGKIDQRPSRQQRDRRRQQFQEPAFEAIPDPLSK